MTLILAIALCDTFGRLMSDRDQCSLGRRPHLNRLLRSQALLNLSSQHRTVISKLVVHGHYSFFLQRKSKRECCCGPVSHACVFFIAGNASRHGLHVAHKRLLCGHTGTPAPSPQPHVSLKLNALQVSSPAPWRNCSDIVDHLRTYKSTDLKNLALLEALD